MLKNLKKEYGRKKKIIKSRLDEFSRINGNQLFYELCFCILTPQSNAKKCDLAVSTLKEKDFLKRNIKSDNIKQILKQKTRFYRNKSNYLKEMKNNYNILCDILSSDKFSSIKKREYLVNNVKGMGMKEASHYLRNTGHKNLAILDRHILKNLKRYRAIDEIPKTMTKKHYLKIEEQFKKFSKRINIPMDELDLLFWSMETGEVFK
ncbi:MAG: N-glycosylase/DNA lyase [Candidatus Woesearchaeota archaeon]